MILAALDEAGGVEYLKKRATDTPGPFLALIGKVLPTTLAGDPDAPLAHVTRVELIDGDGKDSAAA